MSTDTTTSERHDHRTIMELIPPGSRILDLGCGDGLLMDLLQREKSAKVQGVELDENSIYHCVARGLSVVHSDFETGLTGFPDQSFDYVIFNESLQEVRNVDRVMRSALRVGRKVIVGFPNFGLWKVRWDVLWRGRSPITKSLPYHWHNSPNVRFLSVTDFEGYCKGLKLRILDRRFLSEAGPLTCMPNWRATTAIFVIAAAER